MAQKLSEQEVREKFLNFNIDLTEKLLGVKFTGSTMKDKEEFYDKHQEELGKATSQMLMEMHDVFKISSRALSIFPDSFINRNNELIFHPKGNVYFRLEDCHTEMDFKCKMMAWLSRPIAKGLKRPVAEKLLKSFNEFLETNFSMPDMELIYEFLGNDINRELSIKFIDSGYDLSLLTK